jgi:hypothetical protein
MLLVPASSGALTGVAFEATHANPFLLFVMVFLPAWVAYFGCLSALSGKQLLAKAVWPQSLRERR